MRCDIHNQLSMTYIFLCYHDVVKIIRGNYADILQLPLKKMEISRIWSKMTRCRFNYLKMSLGKRVLLLHVI